MFDQDFDGGDFGGGMSDDDRGRSPRGAGSAAKVAADNAERRMAADPAAGLYGVRKRGQKTPFGGEAFGMAPQSTSFLDPSSLGGGAAGVGRIRELRDYSGRAPPSQLARIENFDDDDAAHTAGLSRARESQELSLLSGRKSNPQSAAPWASFGLHAAREELSTALKKMVEAAASSSSSTSSSSSSSSSDKKKKKKKRKKEKKKEKKRLKKESKKEKKRQKKEGKSEKKNISKESKAAETSGKSAPKAPKQGSESPSSGEKAAKKAEKAKQKEEKLNKKLEKLSEKAKSSKRSAQ